jgi:hypothetical protein
LFRAGSALAIAVTSSSSARHGKLADADIPAITIKTAKLFPITLTSLRVH